MFLTPLSMRLILLLGVVSRVTVLAAWQCPADQSGGTGPTTGKAYQIQALNLHNQYRERRGSPPLTMDSTLNALAEQCAAYYAQRRDIDHTCPYKKDAGENLFVGSAVWSQTEMGTMSPKSWYDEVNLYNYERGGFSFETGHFTQVVWLGTKKFGFAATTIDGYTVGVGLYLPDGNWGAYELNVLPANA